MKKILSAGLAVAGLLLAPAVTSAQDGCCCCDTTEGMYIGAYGGVSWAHDQFLTDSDTPGIVSEVEHDIGWNVGGFFGFRCCNGFRLEGEVGYRSLDVDKLHYHQGSSVGTISDFSNSDFTVINYMANFIYECAFVVCDCCWRPYFGVGFGGATVNYEVTEATYLTDIDDDETVFAYQLIMGLAYPVNECMDIAIEYRFFSFDEVSIKDKTGATVASLDYTNVHNIMVSAKYVFGGLW